MAIGNKGNNLDVKVEIRTKGKITRIEILQDPREIRNNARDVEELLQKDT